MYVCMYVCMYVNASYLPPDKRFRYWLIVCAFIYFTGARCSSVIERTFISDGRIPVCGMVHIKDPLRLSGKRALQQLVLT